MILLKSFLYSVCVVAIIIGIGFIFMYVPWLIFIVMFAVLWGVTYHGMKEDKRNEEARAYLFPNEKRD